MVRVDHEPSAGKLVFVSMAEFGGASLQAVRDERRVVRDGAEREHGLDRCELHELGREVPVAGADFGWLRLVVGWQALHGVRDARADESQPIVAIDRRWGARQT